MKSRYKIGAAVIGSFVLGIGAASVLHAQARPPAYVWAEVDIKDVVGWGAGSRLGVEGRVMCGTEREMARVFRCSDVLSPHPLSLPRQQFSEPRVGRADNSFI